MGEVEPKVMDLYSIQWRASFVRGSAVRFDRDGVHHYQDFAAI
jgi:hypothetical protein